MSTLSIASPTLAFQLEIVLKSDGKDDLARKILALKIQHCTFGDDPGVGSIYFERPPYPVPEVHKEAADVKETISFGSENGFNIDFDHENNVIGIEYVCRKDIGDEVRKYVNPPNVPRLRKLIVNRFADLRFTAGGLAVAAAIAYVVTKVEPSFTFSITFGLTVVIWLFVGLSTLADE